jgi:hypothetical protein
LNSEFLALINSKFEVNVSSLFKVNNSPPLRALNNLLGFSVFVLDVLKVFNPIPPSAVVPFKAAALNNITPTSGKNQP